VSSRAQQKTIRGVIVPVITPVDDEDRVDEAACRAVIRRCLDAGVDGIFAGGSAGMGPLLTETEWRRAMETAAAEVNGRAWLLGGVIAPSTAVALERIRFLERAGYRHMVVTPTYYIRLSRQDEFLAHFEACRQATDMDMVAYNIPGCTASTIPAELTLDMARKKWISVCKESSEDREYFLRLLREGKPLGLAMLQGCEADIEWGLNAGAAGLVPVCANYEPATFVTAWRASQSGAKDVLARAQLRVNQLRAALVRGNHNWICGIMYAVSRLGIGNGHAVRPLRGLSEQSRRAIDSLALATVA